ncbi:hypothetical protein EJB05_14232, partial [Eragrostis curvula]
MAPAAELVDDLVAETLLRLPPDEPAGLVRASLVCKPWRRLLTDRAFLRRYREFHRAPPMLGFFHNSRSGPNFVRTSSGSPCPRRRGFDWSGCRVVDCRHGRVLLHWPEERNLVVWDPVTGDRKLLHTPGIHVWCRAYSAAVLCAADGGCDHLDCHGRPFAVVLVSSDLQVTEACVYSSESGSWSAPASIHHWSGTIHVDWCSAGVPVGDDGIFFATRERDKIVKYSLGQHCLSVIDAPSAVDMDHVLVSAENGSLGIATIKDSSLCLWLRKEEQEEVAAWELCSVTELDKLIPPDYSYNHSSLIYSAEGLGIIFVRTDVGVFMVELKSRHARKVGEGWAYYNALPLFSFYTTGKFWAFSSLF